MAEPEKIYIPRRVIQQSPDRAMIEQPIAAFRDCDAYVLLAEPGAGKSDLLKNEAAADPVGGKYMTVRAFLRSDLYRNDSTVTWYIDAMDEQRASASTGAIDGPLDDLIARLEQLGKPRFRLACREADWLALDTEQLKDAAPNGEIATLHLQPLDADDILALVQSWVPEHLVNPHAFIAAARSKGLESMLGNPMLLELLVRAVEGGAWPASREGLFQIACRKLAQEQNTVHQRAKAPDAPVTDEILDDAGLLCAVLLLSDRTRFRMLGADLDDSNIALSDLPSDVGISRSRALAALNTTLFVSDGEERCYRHRVIAEFLGGRALAKILSRGLPIARLMTLMSGTDGGIVEPLRGLYAWLVSLYPQHRDIWMQRDVLAVIYYGDMVHFTIDEKRHVLTCLYRMARRHAWFNQRHWESKAFGALGIPDMETSLAAILSSEARDDVHEAVLLCVLEAIEHGEPMPDLLRSVAAIAACDAHWGAVRQFAVSALIAQSEPGGPYLLPLLDAIRCGQVPDEDDELAGELLGALYPAALDLHALIGHLHRPKAGILFGSYRNFWRLRLWTALPDADVALLADDIASLAMSDESVTKGRDFSDFYYQAIAHALERQGQLIPVAQLYRWMIAGVNDFGHRVLYRTHDQAIAHWLSEHPVRLKELYEYGLACLIAQRPRSMAEAWQRTLLDHNSPPDDWHTWLLEVAGRRTEEALVRFCFETAAFMAAHAPQRFPGGLEQVAAWQEMHAQRWPAAESWCQSQSFSTLDDWHRDQAIYMAERAAQLADAQNERRRTLAPEMSNLLAGTAPPELMAELLGMADHGGYGVEGDTAEARVACYLGSDAATARQVLAALPLVLDRHDLPTWQEVVHSYRGSDKLRLKDVCLRAADLVFEREASHAKVFQSASAGTLLAFSLVNGQRPVWFATLAMQQPELVADVMSTFLTVAWQRRDQRLDNLRWLADCPASSTIPHVVFDHLLPQIAPPVDAGAFKSSFRPILLGALAYATPAVLALWLDAMLGTTGADMVTTTAVLTAALAMSNRRMDILLGMLDADIENALACAGILIDLPQASPLIRGISVADLERLLVHLARHGEPATSVTLSQAPQEQISAGVARLVIELAARPVMGATEALERLRHDATLQPWATMLADAEHRNAKLVRESTFQFAQPDDVCGVLANYAPRTEADLIAYFLEHASALMQRIRFGQTNLLRRFWRTDDAGGVHPYPENECRDLFLDLLDADMRVMGVHIEKERHTARDKRADLSLTVSVPGRKISVPVEVKLDSHRKVWRAWQTQLMDLYATDPVAGGRGVYFVMYFDHKTQRSPARQLPASAQEMARLLGDLVPSSYFNRMFGLVLDFSWPVAE